MHTGFHKSNWFNDKPKCYKNSNLQKFVCVRSTICLDIVTYNTIIRKYICAKIAFYGMLNHGKEIATVDLS